MKKLLFVFSFIHAFSADAQIHADFVCSPGIYDTTNHECCIIFTNISSGNIVSWYWDFDGGAGNGCFSSFGNHIACLTVFASNGDSDRICKSVIVDSSGCDCGLTLGINVINNSSIITLSPNPATNNVTIQLSNEKRAANVTLSIYNAFGRKIHQELINEQLTTINLKYPTGIYFLRFSDGEKTFSQKLIIQ